MIKYSENGLWIKQEDNRYTVGISPKGQDDIGDVSFVELFNQETLTTEDSFMSVEAAKAVTEFVSPLSFINSTLKLALHHPSSPEASVSDFSHG